MVNTNRKKECKNCHRVMSIQMRGLCGGCNNVAKCLAPGSPEYQKALAEAAKRFNDPNYKHGNRHTVKKQSAEAAAPKKSVLDHTIKQVARAGRTGIPAIIAQARDERDFHMAEVEKLRKAINILESL